MKLEIEVDLEISDEIITTWQRLWELPNEEHAKEHFVDYMLTQGLQKALRWMEQRKQLAQGS